MENQENQEQRPDQTAKQYYENFKSNPTNGFLNHHDIFSILMSKMEYKDKLDFINKYTKADPPLDNLKGLNKQNVIDTIVKPILANTDDAARMTLKGDINAMKEAASEKFKNNKTEKGDIKFIEAKVSKEEYLDMLVQNRDSIKNGAKNENSVSTAMLLLAYSEKNELNFNDILKDSGVSKENISKFMENDVFNHTPVTNEIKKLITREINADIKNVNTFKNLTNFVPSQNLSNDVEKTQAAGVKR